MVGFAQYTNSYETRLGRQPFYRKGARGPDQLATFAMKKGAEYAANAGRIRDMRFAQSNEYNIDRAIRSKRERDISNVMDTVADKRELEGLRGRTSMKLSRTGGALSRYSIPGVVKGDTPMSLTVEGLASAGVTGRSRSRTKAMQRKKLQQATSSPPAREQQEETETRTYTAKVQHGEGSSPSSYSTATSNDRIGHRTGPSWEKPSTPQILGPALRQIVSSKQPERPLQPQPPSSAQPLRGPPMSNPRPVPVSSVRTHTTPAAGFGAGAGAGMHTAPRQQQLQNYEQAQQFTNKLVNQQTSSGIANNPSLITKLRDAANSAYSNSPSLKKKGTKGKVTPASVQLPKISQQRKKKVTRKLNM